MEPTAVVAGILTLALLALAHPVYTMNRMNRHKRSLAAAHGLKQARVTWLMRYRWFAHNMGGGPKAAMLAPLAAFGYPVAQLANLPDPVGKNVWIGGTPREWCSIDLQVKTVANVLAGVAVIRDTDDDHFQVAGADPVTVLGFCSEINWTDRKWTGAVAPTTEDIMQVVLIGQGALISARNVTALLAGALVTTDATGSLKALQTDTIPHAMACVGRVLQDSDGSVTPERAIIGGAF